jgi:hypothetical protein
VRRGTGAAFVTLGEVVGREHVVCPSVRRRFARMKAL